MKRFGFYAGLVMVVSIFLGNAVNLGPSDNNGQKVVHFQQDSTMRRFGEKPVAEGTLSGGIVGSMIGVAYGSDLTNRDRRIAVSLERHRIGR